ncbi:MAG: hypothetical protein Q9162_006539 [Coniocarpon cinnabarinum]
MSDKKGGKLVKHEGAGSVAQSRSGVSPTLQQQRQALDPEQRSELQRMEEHVKHAIEDAGKVWHRLKRENSEKAGDDKLTDGQLIHHEDIHHFKLFGRYPDGYEEEERARREESHKRMQDDYKEMFPGTTDEEFEHNARGRFDHMMNQDQHGQSLQERKAIGLPGHDALSASAHVGTMQKLEGPAGQHSSKGGIAGAKEKSDAET